ncbi:MAG: hypothetical protein GY694_15965, partial [Gammaproteobacteria bacterium]|nr:hypothetical protein [Gammaproteobacteria bacterium]
AIFLPEVPQPEIVPAQNAEHGYFSDDDAPDKSLMIRLALTSEILSLQLDKVLGRQSPPGPYVSDHERNTNFGVNVRLNHIRASMENREIEFPEINQPLDTGNNNSDQDVQEVQDDQTNQSGHSNTDRSIYERIDFSSLQESSETTYPMTSGASLTETSENYQADDEATGPGNNTTEVEYYRGEGEEIVSQILANEGANSFALLYNDGSAHFQGSAPTSSFDLSAIEPYGEELNSNEAHDDNESEDVLDLELPFKFEHEFK